MLRLRAVFSLIMAFALSPVATAGTLEKAQAAYESGGYAESSKLYLEYVEAEASSPNGSVFHNLGLAFDREKELGPAVAAYLRALQLRPRQDDFQYNLRFLLGKAEDKLDSNFPVPTSERLFPSHIASEHEIFYAGLVFLVLTALFMSYGILQTRLKKSALSVSGIAALLTIYCSIGLYLKVNHTHDVGAISAPKVEAYSGPTQSVVIFELHEGAPFQIVDSSGDWVKIELSDQKRGWVRKEGIVSFGRDQIILPPHVSSKS
ncbi:MAG: hypothetical protein H7249_01605 [Chitinophagaceae bacterium]|nr:hypothetical protein [Oligoflexus sp.]